MDKNDRFLEERPNVVTGKAKRWVKKPSAADFERGRQTAEALRSIDEAPPAEKVDLARGLGAPPRERAERFEYRRRVIVNGIRHSESLSGEEKLLLGARFGLDGEFQSLEELAEKNGTTRENIRKREIVAMRKVENEFPELVEKYNFRWADQG